MKIITQIVAGLIVWPLIAWEFMLAVGIAHLHWWPAIPVIGYPTALLITFLLFSMFTGGTLTTIMHADSKR